MKAVTVDTVLIIDGRAEDPPQKINKRVVVNGREFFIHPRSFDYLMALVNGLTTNNGWVHKHDLPGIERERKEVIIWRLKEQTGRILPILNNRRGSYKLVVKSVEVME